MLEQVLNDSVLIRDNVWNDLFLFPVDEKLHNFAEISSKNGIDLLFGSLAV